MKSLGPSNDDSDAVRLEIRAAKHLGDFGPDWPMSDVWDMGGGTLAFGSSEHLPETWAWDISRPIAEQLAETASDDAAAEALVQVTPENLTDEQIREFHDYLDLDVEGDGVLALHCSTALMPENAMSAQAFPAAKAAARRRVCEAINARRAAVRT